MAGIDLEVETEKTVIDGTMRTADDIADVHHQMAVAVVIAQGHRPKAAEGQGHASTGSVNSKKA